MDGKGGRVVTRLLPQGVQRSAKMNAAERMRKHLEKQQKGNFVYGAIQAEIVLSDDMRKEAGPGLLKRRHVILYRKFLVYYKSEGPPNHYAEPKGFICLEDVEHPENVKVSKNSLEIGINTGRTFMFVCESSTVAQKWAKVLQEKIEGFHRCTAESRLGDEEPGLSAGAGAKNSVLSSLNQRLRKVEALLTVMSDQMSKQVKSSRKDGKTCMRIAENLEFNELRVENTNERIATWVKNLGGYLRQQQQLKEGLNRDLEMKSIETLETQLKAIDAVKAKQKEFDEARSSYQSAESRLRKEGIHKDKIHINKLVAADRDKEAMKTQYEQLGRELAKSIRTTTETSLLNTVDVIRMYLEAHVAYHQQCLQQTADLIPQLTELQQQLREEEMKKEEASKWVINFSPASNPSELSTSPPSAPPRFNYNNHSNMPAYSPPPGLGIPPRPPSPSPQHIPPALLLSVGSSPSPLRPPSPQPQLPMPPPLPPTPAPSLPPLPTPPSYLPASLHSPNPPLPSHYPPIPLEDNRSFDNPTYGLDSGGYDMSLPLSSGDTRRRSRTEGSSALNAAGGTITWRKTAQQQQQHPGARPLPAVPGARPLPIPGMRSAKEAPPILPSSPPPLPPSIALRSLPASQPLVKYYGPTTFSFEVEKVGGGGLVRTASRVIMLDVDTRKITIYNAKQQTSDSKDISNLLQVTRPSRNFSTTSLSSPSLRELEFVWKGGDSERFSFMNPTQREQFLSAAHLVQSEGVIKTQEQVSVFVGSWNVGESAPPENLSQWIVPNEYDIYAIGTQECEYPPRPGKQTCEIDWFACVQNTLGPNYVTVAGASLMQMRLVVLVRREHLYKVRHLAKATVATGIGNVIGNKGGVGVSFTFNETPMLFVTCHLAAHQQKSGDRNTNFKNIMKSFSSKLIPEPYNVSSGFPYIFWCGDLNYRLDKPRDEVVRLVSQQNFEVLYTVDQLARERRLGNAFVGFHEGPIYFPPTYRYIRGERVYNEEKGRIPSWCDRILWKTIPGFSVTQTSYGCCDLIMTSDHSPIFSTFVLSTHLPPPPTEPQLMQIKLSELQLVEIRDKADEAFLYIGSPLLPEGTVSSMPVSVPGTIACWKDEDLPVLFSFSSDRGYIESLYIVVQVKTRAVYRLKDKDFKKDEEVGQTTISLRNTSNKILFNEPVFDKSGEVAARLMGAIQVVEMLNRTTKRARKEGYLIKKGGKRRNWKRRWFVLTDSGEMSYFDSPSDPPIKTFPVYRCSQLGNYGKKNTLSIESLNRTFLVCADTEAEMQDWLQHLTAVCQQR